MSKSIREEIIRHYQGKPQVSVLIVGGGVNGIGVFRDLALQGIDVLLVDKGDFCSGASAASSHMVHGGLRYLENGEFRLVREALTERNLLLKNAPHYVKPLPTTIPIFKWFSGMLNAPLKFLGVLDRPSERGALIIKAGLSLYDWFTWTQQSLPRHKFFSKRRSLQKRPLLNPDIVCTATYYDGWMPYPERICLEMILDAEIMSDTAHALNYVRVMGAWGNSVSLQDELSGESFNIEPDIVVNAAGPWVDFANETLTERSNYIGGTKGSHLVVDHPELHRATQGHEMFFENEDGRITLFLPLGDKVLLGTTDIPIDDPEDAICTEEEVDYILNALRIVFPTINVTRDHVVYSFSGVRPLPASNAANPGQISRDHSIKVIEPSSAHDFPIYSLVGGKWTSFRAFAEQTTDRLLARMRQPRRVSTRHMAIGGGKGYPDTEGNLLQWLVENEKKTQVPQARLRTLFERYGTRAESIAALAGQDDEALQSLPDYSRNELRFIAQEEKVVHLEDLLQRRTLLAMGGYLNTEALEEIADIVSDVLGWSVDQKQAEIERTRNLLQTRHHMAL